MAAILADAPPPIVLDLSRLLSRVLHPTPTGVDRVEMAYARGLLRAAPDRLRFGAVHPAGGYGRLPTPTVERFLDATEARWLDERTTTRGAARLHAARWLTALRPRRVIPSAEHRRTCFVQASPNHLTDPRVTRSILAREGARFVCLVHDLIPLDYPEYARPGGAALHRRRIETLAAHASGLVANSHATLASLRPFLAGLARPPLTTVAHLGTTPSAVVARAAPGRPYFICVGTIEPRKNHLLLLHLWRRWAEEAGAAAIPKLVIVGRRGWENEQVLDLLERCPVLRECVEEHNALPDRAVQRLLAGARALLLPSFAEGYGMPVAEALALGLPVLCSDLPALREAGGDVPTFLDPLDGPGWRRAIEDVARDDSPLAAAQASRRATWRPFGWPEHLAILLELLHKLPA